MYLEVQRKNIRNIIKKAFEYHRNTLGRTCTWRWKIKRKNIRNIIEKASEYHRNTLGHRGIVGGKL